MVRLAARVVMSINEKQKVEDFAVDMGREKGISGFVNDTVPVTLHAWLSHPQDVKKALISATRTQLE